MRSFLPILFLLNFIPLLANGQQGGYGFRPNEGQWHPNVEFRADLPNGKLYIEEDALTFDLYDPAKMAAHMGHPHDSDRTRERPDAIPFHAYKVHFKGSDGPQRIRKDGKSRSYSNYYISDDPEDWASKVHAYQTLTYEGLYDGIDLVLRKKDQPNALKYDLIIAPGADPDQVGFSYEGVEELKIDDEGHLIVRTSVGTVREAAPKAFQQIDGEKRKVPCEYVLEESELSFRFPEGYDAGKELVIDPTLIFSTYSGSFSDNFGYTATFDSEGFLYSGSSAFGNSYPTTTGAYRTSYAGGTGMPNEPGTDIAISKYDTSGSFHVWSTYLGGSSDELPHSMIVNENDELFVYGTSSSPDFPVTPSAYDTTFDGGTGVQMNGIGVDYVNGSDIIVSRLSNDGTALLASTFVGGSGNDGLNTDGDLRYNYADEVRGEIIIDEQNRVYIASTTRSNDFPTTSGSYQEFMPGGDQSACVIKMDNNLNSLLWSSFYGGSGEDAAYSLTLDRNDDLFITGGTNSPDLPTDSNTIQPSNAGGRADAFVAHLDKEGDSLINASYWGTDEYDQSYFVRTDGDDHVHLFGQTEKMDSSYIIDAAYATPNSGQYITQMTTEMDSVIWSTVFGAGNGVIDISPTAFLVDLCHRIYLSGWGGSTNDITGLNNNTGMTQGMDITGNAFRSTSDGSDFYLMVLRDDASGIEYGSYMGGDQSAEHVDGGTSRFDRKGRIYQSVCAGCGGNSDFPIEPDPGAVSSTNNANCNNAVFKMDFDLPTTVADMDHPGIVCTGDSVPFTDQSLAGHDLTWDFGDGDSSNASNPTHVYDQGGTYQVTLTVEDTNTCNLVDSVKSTIEVLADTTRSLGDTLICKNGNATIGIHPVQDSSYSFQWQPSTGLSDTAEPNPVASPDTSTSYQLLLSNGVCTDTLEQTVNVRSPTFSLSSDTNLCPDADSVLLEGRANPSGSIDRWIWTDDGTPPDTLSQGPNENSIEVFPEDSSDYVLTGIEGDCNTRDTVSVKVHSIDATIEEGRTICLGDTVDLEVQASGTGNLDLDWEPDEAIIEGDSSSQITVSPDMNSTFAVTVSNQYCDIARSVTVGVSELGQSEIDAWADDDTIASGTSTEIHAEPDQGYDLIWSPSEGLSDPSSPHTRASPEESTTYRLRMSEGECKRTDSVRIEVYDIDCGRPDLFLPNAFTPNEDGENDVLYVRGKNVREMTLRIYDRWGEKVFESHSQENGWNGTYKGEELEPDVYAYYLEVTCVGGEEFFEKGNITLIR